MHSEFDRAQSEMSEIFAPPSIPHFSLIVQAIIIAKLCTCIDNGREVKSRPPCLILGHCVHEVLMLGISYSSSSSTVESLGACISMCYISAIVPPLLCDILFR